MGLMNLFGEKDNRKTGNSDEYYDIYKTIKSEAESIGLSVGYLDDSYIMREYISKAEEPKNVSCKILNRYESSCIEGQLFKKKLHTNGTRMSVVAVNDDDLTIIDLREFVSNEILEWTVPQGNWNIEEYVCTSAENGYVNDFSEDRLHHEIYLSDPRKAAPEKWKTVIRHPIKGKD